MDIVTAIALAILAGLLGGYGMYCHMLDRKSSGHKLYAIMDTSDGYMWDAETRCWFRAQAVRNVQLTSNERLIKARLNGLSSFDLLPLPPDSKPQIVTFIQED
jgi:hypothetical protein